MATQRFKISPGKAENQVVSEVGAANNSDVIEVTIDLSTALVGEGGSTRAVTREEVLEGLMKVRDYILTTNWLP